MSWDSDSAKKARAKVKNPAGSKQKKVLRELLSNIADDNNEKFKTELMTLKGKAFIDSYLGLLEYCTPKLNRTDLTNDGDKFEFGLNDEQLIKRASDILNRTGKV